MFEIAADIIYRFSVIIINCLIILNLADSSLLSWTSGLLSLLILSFAAHPDKIITNSASILVFPWAGLFCLQDLFLFDYKFDSYWMVGYELCYSRCVWAFVYFVSCSGYDFYILDFSLHLPIDYCYPNSDRSVFGIFTEFPLYRILGCFLWWYCLTKMFLLCFDLNQVFDEWSSDNWVFFIFHSAVFRFFLQKTVEYLNFWCLRVKRTYLYNVKLTTDP